MQRDAVSAELGELANLSPMDQPADARLPERVSARVPDGPQPERELMLGSRLEPVMIAFLSCSRLLQLSRCLHYCR